jgi:hypothetical protein
MGGPGDGFRAALHVLLLVDVLEVAADGLGVNAEFDPDHAVGKPPGQQFEHLDFGDTHGACRPERCRCRGVGPAEGSE